MAIQPRKIRQLPPAQAPSDADVFPVSQMNAETGVATTRAMTRLQLQSDLIKVINDARQQFVDTANLEHKSLQDQINALQHMLEENEATDAAIHNGLVMLQQALESGESGKTVYDLWIEAGNTGSLQDYLNSLVGPPGTTSWNGITDKPSTFNPSSHSHPVSDIVGLQSSLDGKAATVHSHNQGEITGLTSSLDAIQDQIDELSESPPGWSAVTGKPETFPPQAHNHQISQVVGLQAALDGKISSVVWGDVGNKPTTFPAAWGDVTGKPTTFTPATHSHAIADVSGLQTALDGKWGSATLTTTTRAIGTAFRPSTSKWTLVSYTCKTQVTNPLIAGASTATVQLLSDTNATPTTERGRLEAVSSVALAVAIAITTANTATLTYLVPPNHYVLLKSTVAGTGATSIVSQVEETLG